MTGGIIPDHLVLSSVSVTDLASRNSRHDILAASAGPSKRKYQFQLGHQGLRSSWNNTIALPNQG